MVRHYIVVVLLLRHGLDLCGALEDFEKEGQGGIGTFRCGIARFVTPLISDT